MKRLSLAVDHKPREEQAGFRRGRGCIDHIFTLRNYIEQNTEWQRTLREICRFCQGLRQCTPTQPLEMESPSTLLRLSKASMITSPPRLVLVTSCLKSTLVSDRGVSCPHCFSTLLWTGSCGVPLRIRSGASDGRLFLFGRP